MIVQMKEVRSRHLFLTVFPVRDLLTAPVCTVIITREVESYVGE
jgi:hypothetical protein